MAQRKATVIVFENRSIEKQLKKIVGFLLSIEK